MRRLALAGILASLIAAPATAADEAPTVGRGELVAGQGLEHWLVAWDRWAFSFTRTQVRHGSDCLPQGNGSPVRFLGIRTREEHVYEIHCNVSTGQYLMLGQPGVVCSSFSRLKGFPDTPSGLERCARRGFVLLSDPHPRFVLDGRAISAGPVVQTGFFRFGMPARDNQAGKPGMTRAGGAGAQRVTMVRPLPPGEHTLISGNRYRGEHNVVVVYKLSVS